MSRKAERKLRETFAKLDAIYSELPHIECKGKCAVACGPIPLTDLEARRLQLTTHVAPRTRVAQEFEKAKHSEPIHERCIYLTADERCGAYAVRPLICRVYGLVKM